jgi:hypothetical protein
MHVRNNTFSKQVGNLFPLLIIVGVGIALSGPVFSQPIPGVDAPMHLSKISRLWTFFPSLPAWFPWWYCGIPLLKSYPPLMYVTDTSVTSLFHLEPWLSLGVTDTVFFVLTGCFIYLFLRRIGLQELACLSSAILYLSSFQTLSGRFGYGHYAHTFALFFLVFGLYLAAKAHATKYYEVSLAGILCLLILSHPSVTLAFIGMLVAYYVGVFVAKLVGARTEQRHIFPFFRSLIGGTFGVLLSAFWFIPYLMSGGSGAVSFMGSAATYVPPIQSLFLFNSQDIWWQSYYLGIPLIIFGALGLVVSFYKRVFWGVIFATWTLFFLFLCIQPLLFQGLSLGYPARYLFFFSFSWSLLSGIALDYTFRNFSGRFSKLRSKILSRSILVFLLLSYAISVNPVVIKGYEMDNRIAQELSPYLGPYERLASISTFSYTFNVMSNKSQIDGGYIEGNINMEFYRTYWYEIFSGSDLEATVNILRKLNARLVLFDGEIAPEVEKKFIPPYFSIVLNEPPIKAFELNRTLVPLNFVEVSAGYVDEGSFSYTNPDALEFAVVNCSKNAELTVKMNYDKGWAFYCNNENLPLVKNDEGFMNVTLPFEGNVKIKLQYGSTLIDKIALGITITGALTFLFLLFGGVSRIQRAANFFSSKKKSSRE